MASPPPPELMDELVGEILLRLPPVEPEHLFRAALVCKPWLRILCDPAFGRRYRAFHGAPPLLGLLPEIVVDQGDRGPRIFSNTSIPDFRLPGSDGCLMSPLDCRHGLVLIYIDYMLGDEGDNYLVWDPITGDKHGLPAPDSPLLIDSAAVLCAADYCDHLDCHGGPFRVVLMGTLDFEDNIVASVYSSETGVWSAPVAFDNAYEASVLPGRGALVGDAIYFTICWKGNAIKYEWGQNFLSMINLPSPATTLMAMDDGSLGSAYIEGSSLYILSRKVNSEGAAEWVQFKVIELETIIPGTSSDQKPFVVGFAVVGFAEGVGVIFIRTDVGLFTIELKSERVRKVNKPLDDSVLSYMSFYTPDRGRLLSLARTH
ncbi:unnamed protein product [Urochloa decumbens]|uniref:F-box domain-containing protein n=1 Tax=Urochloa decumbens TaxID=240449 RepID=A0ABC9D2F6_9POAL